MLQRIKSVQPLSDYMLSVVFDDDFHVVYDVKGDMNLPGYDALRTLPGLFASVQLDESRTCVYWNDTIDLPSDAIRQYGRSV